MDKKQDSTFNKLLKKKMKGEKDQRPSKAKLEMLARDYMEISVS